MFRYGAPSVTLSKPPSNHVADQEMAVDFDKEETIVEDAIVLAQRDKSYRLFRLKRGK